MRDNDTESKKPSYHVLANMEYSYANTILVQSSQDDIGVGFANTKIDGKGDLYFDYHSLVRMPIRVAKVLADSLNQAISELEDKKDNTH